MSDWLKARRYSLKEALRKIRDKNELIVVQPYFPLDGSVSNARVLYAGVDHFEREPDFECDIFFGQGNGVDIGKLFKVRQSGRAVIHASWFWDNHHLFAECMHIAMLSDVYFCGHRYKSGYLRNELSLPGGFVPMLPIAWTQRQVEAAAESCMLAPRSNKLYGGYNSYPQFSRRDKLIEEIIKRVPESAVFITPHGTPHDQHPYNSLSAEDRIRQWMHHKVTLCLSVDRDITMRMFDALLTGSIPLLFGRPDDLDEVIPRGLQDMLPIVVMEDQDVDSVNGEFQRCLEMFDEGGHDGILRRNAFVASGHMPQHRLGWMIDRIRALAEDPDNVDAILGA